MEKYLKKIVIVCELLLSVFVSLHQKTALRHDFLFHRNWQYKMGC